MCNFYSENVSLWGEAMSALQKEIVCALNDKIMLLEYHAI